MQSSRKLLTKAQLVCGRHTKTILYVSSKQIPMRVLNKQPLSRPFSTSETQQEAPIEEEIIHENPSTHQFQAETKRLLHIVAKSLYTDKDVFIRELLSNASDAIEKQRYMILTGAQSEDDDVLQINLMTNEAKRQLIIQDTGIGMSKEDLIEHLGTIASSGSGKFLQKLKETNSNVRGVEENIIGQFGVGFYAAFIVADTVEVITKKEDGEAYSWISDGSGSFEISKVPNFHLNRGTRIILHLKPESANYTRPDEIKKIIEKYSNFISHPIFINHEKINIVTALWARDKREIGEEEYRSFFEHLAKSKSAYKYKIHYSTDVPLSLKALLYLPAQNPEMYGFNSQDVGVHLYSKKVLIKSNCREIIPNYLRFVKGVVDCEDLPLNISRENYQDSNLILKIRNVVTKRILKLLEQESKNNPEDYIKWHKDFHLFLKEGLHSDRDNSELILSLSRFDSNFGEQISLDQYIEKMKPEQKNIYYFLTPNAASALHSPYMEPFIVNDVPVLYISINVEEMLFRQLGEYKKFKFINIESSEAELPAELLKEKKEVVMDKEKVPEDDMNLLCMWIKNELQPVVVNVVASKRLQDSPAVVVSSITSGMRQMMAFLDQSQISEMSKNLTLEINPTHPIIVKLNKMRAKDIKSANFNLKQLLDSCLMAAGIPFDQKVFINRINAYILQNLEAHLDETRKIEGTSQQNEVIVEENTGFNVLNEALKASREKTSAQNNDNKIDITINEKGEPEIKL